MKFCRTLLTEQDFLSSWGSSYQSSIVCKNHVCWSLIEQSIFLVNIQTWKTYKGTKFIKRHTYCASLQDQYGQHNRFYLNFLMSVII